MIILNMLFPVWWMLLMVTYFFYLVLDSSAKVPDGLMTRSLVNIGQFDECLEIDHPLNKFQGKHCMISLGLGTQQKQKTTIFGGFAVSINLILKPIS